MATQTISPDPAEDFAKEDDNPTCTRPANAIETKQVVITVISSLYQLEKRIPTCIVVVDVSFDLEEDMGLAHAAVPLDLKAYEITAASMSALASECYIHDHYTGRKEEAIIMARYEMHTTTTIMPNMELGVANNLTAKWSNVGRVKDFSQPVEKGITLVGQNLKNNMQVKWIFGNESRRHFPRNIRLMIIIKKTKESQNPYFPFFLDLGKKLRVSVFGGRFTDRVVMLFRKSRPEPIPITGDWATEIAQDALTDIPKFQNDGETPQYIGLRAARRITLMNT